jgi:hypothetical protein
MGSKKSEEERKEKDEKWNIDANWDAILFDGIK